MAWPRRDPLQHKLPLTPVPLGLSPLLDDRGRKVPTWRCDRCRLLFTAREPTTDTYAHPCVPYKPPPKTARRRR